MTINRRSRRPKKDDGFWTEYVRSGTFDPATPAYVPPTVAEAERLLEEARLAEAHQAAALALQAEDDQRRREEFELQSATDLAALEEQLDAELAAAPGAGVSPDRELRVLSRGFLHGFAPRGIKRMPPQDLIAARDDFAARLLEIAREAELMYDRFTSSWAEVPLAVDHPFASRADAIEVTAWRAFVHRVRALAGESVPSGHALAADRSSAQVNGNQGVHAF